MNGFVLHPEAYADLEIAGPVSYWPYFASAESRTRGKAGAGAKTRAGAPAPHGNGQAPKTKGLEFRGLQNRVNTAPRDNISIALLPGPGQVTFVGSLSSLWLPQNQRLRMEAWTRRDSNPHLRPSRGAVLPLHHGPEKTLSSSLGNWMVIDHIVGQVGSETGKFLRQQTGCPISRAPFAREVGLRQRRGQECPLHTG